MIRIILIMLIFSCSYQQPLNSRGISEDERRFYIKQYGYGISNDMKFDFMNGYTSKGMLRELVFRLYGPPDNTFNNDNSWVYCKRNGEILAVIKFMECCVSEIDDRTAEGLTAK